MITAKEIRNTTGIKSDTEFYYADEVIRIINTLTVCGKIDRKELLERLK